MSTAENCTNRPLYAVLQYGEFIGRQAPYRPPLLVEHGDIELHELHAASERRLIDLFLRQHRRRDQTRSAVWPTRRMVSRSDMGRQTEVSLGLEGGGESLARRME